MYGGYSAVKKMTPDPSLFVVKPRRGTTGRHYTDPCRRLFLLYDDIDNAIADLLVEVALHLLFEVDDLFCSRAVFK